MKKESPVYFEIAQLSTITALFLWFLTGCGSVQSNDGKVIVKGKDYTTTILCGSPRTEVFVGTGNGSGVHPSITYTKDGSEKRNFLEHGQELDFLQIASARVFSGSDGDNVIELSGCEENK